MYRSVVKVKAALAAAVALASLSGCYDPALAPCSVRCSDGCPASLSCEDDGFCHAPGDERVCDLVSDVDAAAPDGGPADARMPSTFGSISAGGAHVCAITTDGHLRCWGSNADHQLGVDGETTGTPVDVPGTGWTAIAAGDAHTCGIRDENLYCWGSNDTRQVGVPDPGPITTPREIGATIPGWFAVAAGDAHTCAIAGDPAVGGTLYCWGYNETGQLGNGSAGNTADMPAPVAATATGETFADWVAVTAGSTHTCALRRSGAAYCWGEGVALGAGDDVWMTRPTPVVDGHAFSAIAAGERTTCAIAGDGLWCWGTTNVGQLPSGAGDPVLRPQRQLDGAPVANVSMTGWGGCATQTLGGVLCWGSGEDGERGDGEWYYEPGPHPVSGLTTTTAITSGDRFHCAIDGSAQAWCWGRNHDGQLGQGDTGSRRTPTRIGDESNWIDISIGLTHACGVTGDQLSCWGYNGQLQLGDADPRATTFEVPQRGFDEVGVGDAHTCAIRNRYTAPELWCWGDDSVGQVGNGALEGDRTAGAIDGPDGPGLDDLVVGPGGNLLLVGSKRYVWGFGGYGGLGTNDTVDVTAPVLAPTPDGIFDGWSHVTLGAGFGCALQLGDLYCWGDDSLGQQGRGPGDDASLVITPSDTSHGWMEVAAGYFHACAATSDRLYCWGGNGDLQVGTGVPGDVDTPTAIGPIGAWRQLATGVAHTCGLLGDELYCWGNNTDGQLGLDGDVAGTPTRVPTEVTGWSRLSAGARATCGITHDHELYCWGDNRFGELGVGIPSQSRPVPVVL